MHYDNFLMDRDSANIKADREWGDSLPWAYHHRDKDYCHMLFTVAGAMQDTFSGLTSGVLALAMSTASGANWGLWDNTLLCCEINVPQRKPYRKIIHPSISFSPE